MTPKKEEALKLALEALEGFTAAEQGDEPPINKAITALKQALEQPEPEPVAWTDENFTELAIDEDIAKEIGATVPLYTSPPKHEPEPVIDKSAAIRIATSLGWTPQRNPLTDEHIEMMWQDYCKQWKTGEKIVIHFVEFARAIEAAHGIKGEA